MSFVLISTTRGDELFPPKTIPVAVSDDRDFLDVFRDQRALEREKWLKDNPLPWWAECAVVDHEDIIEVPSV